MAINPNGDWIGDLLDEQARKNNMLTEGDINDLVSDFQDVSGETLGFQGDSVAAIALAAPHAWGDAPTKTQWGFFQWGH
jgi:hypothetical protein